MSSVWYGGVQCILGLVNLIAIAAMTLGNSTSTIALSVSLLLTGLYALLGSRYMKNARTMIDSYDTSSDQAQTQQRINNIHKQFLRVYMGTTGILVALGLWSFVQGTLLYFISEDSSSQEGSAPAIAGIAAILVNIFIAGCVMADLKRLSAPIRATDGQTRPRSPTPASSGAYNYGMEIATISAVPAMAFPPPYSQIALDPKVEDLPPPYSEQTTTEVLPEMTFTPPESSNMAPLQRLDACALARIIRTPDLVTIVISPLSEMTQNGVAVVEIAQPLPDSTSVQMV